jgi:hypothetical protein
MIVFQIICLESLAWSIRSGAAILYTYSDMACHAGIVQCCMGGTVSGTDPRISHADFKPWWVCLITDRPLTGDYKRRLRAFATKSAPTFTLYFNLGISTSLNQHNGQLAGWLVRAP